MKCPECGSSHIVKNGFTLADKQKYKCQVCKKQFVLNPEKGVISDEKKEAIDRLLLEKMSLAGICRSMKVSKRWLQLYVNEKYANVPKQVNVKKKRKVH